MKRTIVAVLALGLIAQVSMANSLGLFGAYWDPKDESDEIGFGAKLKLDIAPELSLEVRGSYFEFENKTAGITRTTEVIPIEAGLVFNIPLSDTFRPYVGGGAGYYLMDGELKGFGSKAEADLDDEVGYYAVGGLEVILAGNIGLFAEAKYTWVKAKKVTYKEKGFEDVTEKIDHKLDGLGVNVGVLFTW